MMSESERVPTSDALIGGVDGEHGWLSRCACGQTYPPWDVILSIYEDLPVKVSCCGRRLYFQIQTSVHESAVRSESEL